MEWYTTVCSADDYLEYHTQNKRWSFLKRKDGTFLVYKKSDTENEVYDYQGIKLNSTEECEKYMENHQ